MITKWRKEKELQRFFYVISRKVHNSHLNKILKNRYREKYRDKYLDNIYNNEINADDINQNLKIQKMDYLRKFIQDEEEEEESGESFLLSSNIFDHLRSKRREKEKKKVGSNEVTNEVSNDNTGSSKKNEKYKQELESDPSKKKQMSESEYKQAIRIYSLLKLNDKTNIFDEDVFMNMASKINRDIYQFSQNHILNVDQSSDVITVQNFKENTPYNEIEQTKHTGLTYLKNENDTTYNEGNASVQNKTNMDTNFLDITKWNLPIFNPNSFCLAVECLTNQICDDLIFLFQDFIDKSKMPRENENDRLQKMICLIENYFALEKNEKDVDRWVEEVYKPMKPFLPDQLKNISTAYLSTWLKNHINRILKNQKMHNDKLYKKKFYNLGKDFEYDFLLNKKNHVDIKTEYSIDKCTHYFKSILHFFFNKKINVEIEQQLNLLFLNLKQIGLENWLNMDIKDFEKYLLKSKDTNYLNIQERDKYAAYLMLMCASRNITDFFFFEEFSPFYIFNEKAPNENSIEDKIKKIKENEHLPDKEIKKLIYNDKHSSLTILKNNANRDNEDDVNNDIMMDIDLFLEKEKHYNTNRSIITYNYDDQTDTYQYKYKKIPNTTFDFTTNKYIREKETIDPMLKLNEMRSSILEVKRMMSMTKDGRVYYIRVVIIIGNGKGVYGYGVGFGKNIKEARSSALLNSINNIEFLDYNYKNCVLPFPVIGQEYSAHVKIIPRPLGKGLKMNRKYLPLGYILGLDNVKISFSGSSTAWITRIKALKRALNKIISVKTLCQMTGHKYVCHFAPHYCTSHWPDYWFKSILREYENKIEKIKKKKFMVYKKKFRSNISKIPEEVKPDFTPYTWKSPIQKFAESAQLKKYIDTNIYHTDVF